MTHYSLIHPLIQPSIYGPSSAFICSQRAVFRHADNGLCILCIYCAFLENVGCATSCANAFDDTCLCQCDEIGRRRVARDPRKFHVLRNGHFMLRLERWHCKHLPIRHADFAQPSSRPHVLPDGHDEGTAVLLPGRIGESFLAARLYHALDARTEGFDDAREIEHLQNEFIHRIRGVRLIELRDRDALG